MDVNRDAPVYAQAQVDIAAPPTLVWEVLTDFRAWPSWNASVTDVMVLDELKPGAEFRWKADGVTIISTLQAVESPRRLLWTGRSPGIRATHLWLFEEREGGTRVQTEEVFEGLLARLLKKPLRTMLAASLDKALAGLKAESERRHDEPAATG